VTWGSWQAFWAMGGHAPFVWGSYGVTLAVLAAELWLVRRRFKRARDEIESRRKREAQA